MEIHRLNSMHENHSEELFERIYKQTEGLRNKLSREINPRLFGVTSDIILSWFDDKFIHAYNKYLEKYPDKPEGDMKGYIINSLQLFKYRVLRKGYQPNVNNTIDLEEVDYLINVIPDESEIEEKELFVEMAFSFLQRRLSRDAFELLRVETNPPLFILSKLKNPNSKIPIKLIVEYFELEFTKEVAEWIKNLRKEIKEGIEEASIALN